MATAGSLGMKRVNGPALEGPDRIFDKTTFVQRVSVNKDLNIHLICDRETAINGAGCCAPVFMELETTGAGLDLLNQARSETCIAFAEEAEIHGKGVGSLDHALNVPGPRRAGGSVGPRSGPCSSAQHCGQAGVKRFFD